MSNGTAGQTPEEAEAAYQDYVDKQIATCTLDGLARALHAAQDSAAGGHKGFQPWDGGSGPLHLPSRSHIQADTFPSAAELADAVEKSREVLKRYKEKCQCNQQ
jgi:hypothetical protein